MAADGTLVSLDAATGKIIWSQNVAQKYAGPMIEWAFSESPLVDGDRLIVMPGGPGASLVSLNKLDGTLQWKAGSDEAGYSSAVVADVEGVRQVIALSGASAFGVRVDNGQVLWRYERVSNGTANIATPIVNDGHVFLSTDYGTGGALLKLGARGASEVYFTREMMNHYSTSVLVGDVLYGFSNSILTAMRFRTGQVLWRHRSVGKGSLIFADKFLYVLSEDGVLGLVEARPDQVPRGLSVRDPERSVPHVGAAGDCRRPALRAGAGSADVLQHRRALVGRPGVMSPLAGTDTEI